MESWQRELDSILSELGTIENLLRKTSLITTLTSSDLHVINNRVSVARELLEKFLRDRTENTTVRQRGGESEKGKS